jgi:transcriptional regulator with XRE-family HTH domain
MKIAVATNTARTAPIEEPAPLDAAPTAANDETTPGAHFAGLLAPVNRSAMAEIAEEAAEAGDDDEEGRAGRYIGDRGLFGLVIAKRLIAARLLNGLSQTEAANMIGYATPAQLSQWESARRRPPLAALVAYADAMNVSLDYLFGRSDDPERNVRIVRQNACMRAVRATLAGAVERVVDAFNADESIVGLNTSMVRDLAAAAEAVAATYGDFVQPRHAGRGDVGERLASAIGRLENAALKAGIALRKHDDSDAVLKRRLAEIAANDAD